MALIPTATQIGFATGIMLLLPLGDRMDRRTLILRQLVWLTLALLAAAAAPGPVALIAGVGGDRRRRLHRPADHPVRCRTGAAGTRAGGWSAW